MAPRAVRACWAREARCSAGVPGGTVMWICMSPPPCPMPAADTPSLPFAMRCSGSAPSGPASPATPARKAPPSAKRKKVGRVRISPWPKAPPAAKAATGPAPAKALPKADGKGTIFAALLAVPAVVMAAAISAAAAVPAVVMAAAMAAPALAPEVSMPAARAAAAVVPAVPRAVPNSAATAVPEVVGEDMKELPRGTIGRLAVRGPTGCRYLADDRQANYVRDGWNLTGDSFVQDAEGVFHFAARSDDMIISSGYNIAGPEVEAALLSHPDVAECGVIGAP